jgi:hypothetical protein
VTARTETALERRWNGRLDPQPGQGMSVGTLVAAALDPLDIAIVNDQFPLRRLQPPCIAGYEAVVQLGDGDRAPSRPATG